MGEQKIDLQKELRFYNDNNEVRPELYDESAEKIAETLIGQFKGKPQGVSRNQLRNLFDEVKRIKRQLENKAYTWKSIYPSVKLIKSKTSYAVARAKKNGKRFEEEYYNNLKNFIHTGIGNIKSEKDFDIFVNLFEAVYGFYYEKGGAHT